MQEYASEFGRHFTPFGLVLLAVVFGILIYRYFKDSKPKE